MTNKVKSNIQNRLDIIYNKMFHHASTSGTVIYCGLCKNTKISYGKECLICK
jgi:hypothetical protein